MRIIFRALVYSTIAMVLVIVVVIGDLALNKRRIFYAMVGRDAIVAACRPALDAKLRDAGFEPQDIEFGDTPDLTISTLTGKDLKDTFTFLDGAAQSRVDGIVACAVKGADVTLDFKTRTSPTRAT